MFNFMKNNGINGQIKFTTYSADVGSNYHHIISTNSGSYDKNSIITGEKNKINLPKRFSQSYLLAADYSLSSFLDSYTTESLKRSITYRMKYIDGINRWR